MARAALTPSNQRLAKARFRSHFDPSKPKWLRYEGTVHAVQNPSDDASTPEHACARTTRARKASARLPRTGGASRLQALSGIEQTRARICSGKVRTAVDMRAHLVEASRCYRSIGHRY